MVATLQSRKEALQAKIKEKNEELKKLCMQEAELTGVIPPEIPLEPGESPPQPRRRVGTSFSFPQNLINSIKNGKDESLTALELECKVQTNIAEAALTIANDTSANKAVRRKHRLMYRQSQRRLMELETKLTLLRQGKPQTSKQQQHMKKKPRPLNSNEQNPMLGIDSQSISWNQYNMHDSWPSKTLPISSIDEVDNAHDLSLLHANRFGSLHRSRRSSATSRSSGSSRIDGSIEEMQPATSHNTGILGYQSLVPSHSQPNIQGISMDDMLKTNEPSTSHRRLHRRGTVSGHWDTVSAGGTLLPSQTYPEHSHHPNLSRTQSLGSVETNTQRSSRDSWCTQETKTEREIVKEKEWYETSLDSAPSPPLRTSSRLPPAARLLYNLKETQARGNPRSPHAVNKSHPALIRANNMSTFNGKEVIPHMNNSMQHHPVGDMYNVHNSLNLQMQELNISERENSKPSYELSHNKELSGMYVAEPEQFNRFSCKNQVYNEQYIRRYVPLNDPAQGNNKSVLKSNNYEQMWNNGLLYLKQPIERANNEIPDTSYDGGVKSPDSVIINIPEEYSEHFYLERQYAETIREQLDVANISHDKLQAPLKEISNQDIKSPTQPYYHITYHQPKPSTPTDNFEKRESKLLHIDKPQNTGSEQDMSISQSMHIPPHAITQNELVFDTVVPFESPQNHTVIQAGKWQPYREVTKPFEMSDFYKYSTKFRQSKTPVPGNFRSPTPSDPGRISNLISSTHHKGIYQPLQPMTCQAVEYRQSPEYRGPKTAQYTNEHQASEISRPELV